MGRDDLLPKTVGPGVVIAEAEAASPRVWVVAAVPTAARLVPKKFARQPGYTLHCGALRHWWIMSCAGTRWSRPTILYPRLCSAKT